MTKKQWKEYAENLEEELESCYTQIDKQKEINNIAVGENYELSNLSESLKHRLNTSENELYRKEVIMEYLEGKLNEKRN